MAYTKYSLTPANNTAAPPDGAPEGMLPSAVNDTMRDMMAQIRDCGDGIRDGTYTMTAPKITGGTITGSTINNSAIGGTTAAAGAFTTLSATGVTTVQAGTVSAPAITTSGDTNTGIFFPAADTIAFAEGGSEAMRIDSSGQVGIGVSSPSTKLQVSGAASTNNTSRFVAKFTDTSAVAAGNGGGIMFQGVYTGTTTIDCSGIQALKENATDGNYAYAMTFATRANGGDLTEKMRIDSSGNVGIGTSSPNTTAANRVVLEVNGTTSALLNISGGGTRRATLYADSTDCVFGSITSIPLEFLTGGVERMRIDSSGSLLVGQTTAAVETGSIVTAKNLEITRTVDSDGAALGQLSWVNNTNAGAGSGTSFVKDVACIKGIMDGTGNNSGGYITFETKADAGSRAERMRIDSSGNVLVAKTSTSSAVVGINLEAAGAVVATRSNELCYVANRLSTDGTLFSFRQDSIEEGTISVSGSTVSYNGGHLSRWSQLPDGSKDDTILKGTVLTNLDDMCVWEKDGVVADNEQLNKMKVSDVEGDTNVAGVFVNWTRDEDFNSDDMNVAMTGDMIIRIADGVVVQKGDLLMSAGDGTAMPQGDDIVRSKTIAKVTSNHVTCTYADGSYCVPCVLMAC